MSSDLHLPDSRDYAPLEVSHLSGELPSAADQGTGISNEPVITGRLNWSLALMSLAGLLLIAVAVHLFHGRQVSHMAGDVLRRAGEARDAGKYRDAASLFTEYVKFRPQDLEAAAELALSLDKAAVSPRDLNQAWVQMEAVLRKDRDRHDIRLRAAEILMLLGRHSDAATHYEYLLKSPESTDVDLPLARCYAARGDYKAASGFFEAAIERDPTHVEAYGELASVCRSHLNDPVRADATLERMLSLNPQSWEARLIRARSFQETGRVEQAFVDALAAYQIAPDQPKVLNVVADLISSHGNRNAQFDVSTLLASLESHLASGTADEQLIRSAVALYGQAAKPERAQALLKTSLAKLPNSVVLLGMYTEMLLAEGRADLAAEQLAVLKRLDAAPAPLRYFEARIRMLRGEWVPAARLLESVQTDQGSDPILQSKVLASLGDCYEKLGQPERQLAAFEKAMAIGGFTEESRLAVAHSLAKSGQTVAAIEHYRKLTHLPGAALELSRLLLSRVPSNTDASGRWEEVERLLETAASEPGLQLDALLVRAQLEFQRTQGSPIVPEQILDQAAERYPQDARPRIARALLLAARGDYAAAFGVLEQAEQELGAQAELMAAEIRMAARVPAEERDARLTQIGRRAAGGDRDVRATICRELARMHAALGQKSQAREFWLQVAEFSPEDLTAHDALAMLATEQGADAEAKKWLQEVRRIEGEQGFVWRIGEAALQMMTASGGEPGRKILQSARSSLQALHNDGVDSPRLRRLLARAALQLGDPEDAVLQLQASLQLGDRDPETLRILVMVLAAQGRYPEATAAMDKFQEDHPGEARLSGRLASEVFFRADNVSRAVEIVRGSVASGTAQYEDYLWLGLLLENAGDPAGAESALHAAIEVDRTRGSGWASLIEFLLRQNRRGEAEQQMSRMAEHLSSSEPGFSETMAICHEALGNPELATASFRQAISHAECPARVKQRAATFFLRQAQPEVAESVIRDIIKTASTSSAESVRWARRSLAFLLTTKSGYRGAQEGRLLIEENLRESPNSRTDRSAQARLLAVYGTSSDRRTALKLLQELNLDETQPLTQADRDLLTTLVLASGDWEEARRILAVEIMGNAAEDPDRIARVVQLMMEHGEFDATVELWIDKLFRLRPRDEKTIALRLGGRLMKGRFREAETDLNAWLESIQAENDPEKTYRARLHIAESFVRAAAYLQRAGRQSAADRAKREAEERFQQLWEAEGRLAPPYVSLLIGQNRVPDAFALWQQGRDSVSPESAVVMAVDLLQSGRTTPEQRGELNAWIRQVLSGSPDSGSLNLAAATAAHLSGDYDAATTLYARAVQIIPDSVVGLNELAVLLTLHQKDPASALKYVNQAIDRSGPLPFLLDTRAMALLAGREPALAVKDLQMVISDAPSAGAWFHLAAAHLLASDRTAAAQAWRKAVEAGLKPEELHPLERPNYEQLVSQLQAPAP